jgi:hypothetical protein
MRVIAYIPRRGDTDHCAQLTAKTIVQHNSGHLHLLAETPASSHSHIIHAAQSVRLCAAMQPVGLR